MPGKNCGETRDEDVCMDKIVLPYTYYATIFFVSAIEILGLFRFYFIQDESWAYSSTCVMHTLFFVVADIPIFWALTKVKTVDPGYVMPPGVGEDT